MSPLHRHPDGRPISPRRRAGIALFLLGIGAVVTPSALSGAAAGPLTPPNAATLAEARSIVEAMKAQDRGPYSQLRWFCKDGTVLPPKPYACGPHGGGRQHGQYSPSRHRLSELGWNVGTVFAALPWEEFFDGGRRHVRMRELPLERYLTDIDDGWILRKAQYYRGRVQVEDEEAAGRELLQRLLSNRDWVRANYLLARETVRTVPHDGGSDRTREIRRLALELSDRDKSFERLRIKIHNTPGAEDEADVQAWAVEAANRGAPEAVLELAKRLAGGIHEVFGRKADPLERGRSRLSGDPVFEALATQLTDVTSLPLDERLRRLGFALRRTREAVEAASDGRRNLAWIDVSVDLESETVRAGFQLLAEGEGSRSRLLRASSALIEGGYGVGLLSARERDAIGAPVASAVERTSDDSFLEAVRGLRRAGTWGLGAVRYTFAEPLVRYTALEPRAARFPDDVLRGSPLLPLAEATTRLTTDADRVAGVTHRIFGRKAAGAIGLNPGFAAGRLRLLDEAALSSGVQLERTDIIVLPETAADLPPVAGILTLAEGNLLSHIQLLARNLGIPNASVAPSLADELARHDGREVILIVASDGSFVLSSSEGLPAEVEAMLGREAERGTDRVEAPRPDLSVRRPLPLAELHSELAGKVVGPKAANLGTLARTFPGRVAPAIALPFGIFAEHVSRGPAAPKERLDRAFARSRAGEIDAEGLASEISAVREAIAGLSLDPDFQAALRAAMVREFGTPGSYGVFIRSDTNVEDLPGFTGAGLNLTLPHVVDRAALEKGIPLVWSSPFSERAMAWRSSILLRPEQVYTSVLLMKSVPATKSGVLVTTDLAHRDEGLTVAVAWGVGGAVDGESAESVVLEPDGSTFLLNEAKAPYQRALRSGGGVEWVPAPTGAVLTAAEQKALRALADEVGSRLDPLTGPDGRPLPWDIEFGFVEGELALFQIRPLVERGQLLADRALALMIGSPANPVPGGSP